MHANHDRLAAAESECLAVAEQADPGTSSGWPTALLAPVPRPGKILCVGLNYLDHIDEVGLERPTEPAVFSKLPTTLCGPWDAIHLPDANVHKLDYEAELAVVIGQRLKDADPVAAEAAIFGYAVANDVTARDWQFDANQLTLGKGFDTFFPLGPSLVTDADVTDARISTEVNSELRQDSRTSMMVFGVAQIISFLSQVCTLEPGDIVSTGTPEGVAAGMSTSVFLSDGDTVRCTIEGLGSIENRVVATAASHR